MIVKYHDGMTGTVPTSFGHGWGVNVGRVLELDPCLDLPSLQKRQGGFQGRQPDRLAFILGRSLCLIASPAAMCEALNHAPRSY